MARGDLIRALKGALRVRGYSRRTERAYVGWARRYIAWAGTRHPRVLGQEEVNAFLTYLAVEKGVAPGTQNQAACALLFLYEHVVERPLGRLRELVRSPEPKRLPTVLSREEVGVVLSHLRGSARLAALLMYGSGLRLREAMSLRIKDVDVGARTIRLREGKGGDDRVTMLAAPVVEDLEVWVPRVRRRWLADRAAGIVVPLPTALARKYPSAPAEWPWYWLLPARRRTPSGEGYQRWHLHASGVQRRVRRAAKAAGLNKRVTCHTFRHCFATHLLEAHYDIRTIQELMGHKDVRTTMIYTHVLNRGPLGVQSPADLLPPLPVSSRRLGKDT
ncbi:MAG: integron integrase [Gemmatimonadales bacterium]